MTSSERKELHRQDTTNKILAAARELLLAEGVAGLSMRNLAAKVGYSATAIYSYFADKKDVLRALLDADCVALRRAMDGAAAEPDPVERLRKVGRAYVEFGLQHPGHYRVLVMMEPEPGLMDDNPRRGDPAQDAYALLRQAAADGIQAKRFRPEFTDPDQLAQLLWAGVHGVVSLHLNLGREPWFNWCPPKDTAFQMIDVTLRGLIAPDGIGH
jgi:AcrR family transcriptional regulator